MSEIRVTDIKGENGLDAVNFTKGINISSGVCTATTFSGSGASLTSLPAGNLTGTAVATSVVVLTMSSMGLEPNLSILESVSDPQKIAEIRFAFTEGISRAFTLATAIVVISFTLNIFGPNIKFDSVNVGK